MEGTRDYFRLNYNEVIFNIVWQEPENGKSEDINGSLITNEKIYILDSHLKPLRSIKIGSNYSYNFIFSSYWLGKTLLYTTENHIYFTNINGESKIIFSFDNVRSVICNVMADRISIASYLKDEVHITTRKVSLLEPLIMGELSYINDYADFNPELFK